MVKSGRIVRGYVHMNDIPGFGYVSLCCESDLLSVGKLTRLDGLDSCPLRGRMTR